MNRGRRRENIALSEADHEAFLKVLQETAEGWNLKISAYSLMPNHYHLLLQTPDGNLSRCMRHINGVYTQRFNRRHRQDGQLFRGRYKAILIDADSYLLEVLRYIHRNPLHAGLAEELNNYLWSSHQGYLSNRTQWAWLQKDFLLAMLSRQKSRRKAAYLDFVSREEPQEIERFYSLKNLPSVLGTDDFKEWVKDKFTHLSLQEEIPESRFLAPSAEQIIAAVCDHFNVKQELIYRSRRGTENLPRDVAIYLVRCLCRETLIGVGRYFGLHNYSTVSSVVARIAARGNSDRRFQKQLKKLREQITKGQR